MAIYKTDTEHSTIMGRFTWSYVVNSNISRAVRHMVSNKVCHADYATINDILVSALSQNPVAAPSYYSI